MNEVITGRDWLRNKEKYDIDQRRAKEMLQASTSFLILLGRTSVSALGLSPVYAEMRRGEGGEEFPCLKSRTTPDNMERGKAGTLPFEMRMARLSGLDELLQLGNVLRGEMLLTGRPRPLVDDAPEASHHSIAMMERHLSSSVFKKWLDVYDDGPPAVLSTYGNMSKGLQADDKTQCEVRAEYDIKDYERASREHDEDIIAGAMGHLSLVLAYSAN